MANPTKYQPGYSFSGFQASNPRTPLPAPRLDDELANIAQSIGTTIAALGDVRRSDGKLANSIVDLAALSDEVIRELGGAGGGGGDGVIFSSEAQAVAGTSTAVVMSPLRVRQAIATFAGDGGSGSGTVGPQGPKGDKGDTGATGARGATGATGAAGPTGATGAKGDKGDKGDPGDAGSGNADAANVLFHPVGAPTLAIPVSERLGQEVVLTDGYTAGTTDFSDLTEANLARAVATKRPFVIPAGDFRVSRAFSFTETGIAMCGYGKGLSALVWTAGAASTGLRFAARKEYLRPDLMRFEKFALLTEKAAAGTALVCDFAETVNTVFNPSDPTIFDRHSTRCTVDDVSIRGATRETVDGWAKGIDVLYPIDALFRRVHFVGLTTSPADASGIQSLRGIYAGVENGRGHPTGTYYDDCNIWNVQEAIVTEGCEGMVARGNQIVNVHAGIRFKDPLARPLMQIQHNHVNAHGVCVAASACSQIQITENSLYHTLGTDRDGIGVSVSGPSQHAVITGNCFESAINSSRIFSAITIFQCDHGTIDHNTFRSQPAGQAQNMRGITLGGDARFFKVGSNNVFEDNRSGRTALLHEIQDGGVGNRIPNTGARYRIGSAQYFQGEGTVSFDGNVEDRNGGSTPTSMGSGFTVPTDGIYEVVAQVRWTSSSPNGFKKTMLRHNGVQKASALDTSNGSDALIQVVRPARLLCRRGDTIAVSCSSYQGGTINSNDDAFFEARLVA